MKRPRSLLVALAVVLASAALAGTAHATTITELPPLAAGSGPQGIAAGPDGNVWFVENRASRFGRLTPSTGKITDFSTGSGISANSLPAEITAGPDGNLWFTEEAPSRIGRINHRHGDGKGVPRPAASRRGSPRARTGTSGSPSWPATASGVSLRRA